MFSDYLRLYVVWVIDKLQSRGWTADASVAMSLISSIFFMTLPLYPLLEFVFMITGIQEGFNTKIALIFSAVFLVAIIGICIINYFETRGQKHKES